MADAIRHLRKILKPLPQSDDTLPELGVIISTKFNISLCRYIYLQTRYKMTKLMHRHLPVLISLSLTACAGAPQTQVDYVPPTVKFEGTLPCDDCSGIDTTLVLKRNTVTREPDGFYLHEVRLDAPGGERVDTSWGNWTKSRDIAAFQRRIYVLQPEHGTARVYIPRDNGDLQPLGSQGSPLTNDEGESILLRRMTPELSLSSSDTNNESLEDSDG